MTIPDRPNVECDEQHAQLRATDIDAAVDFYITKLGFTLGFTSGEPTQFAGIRLGNQQIFLERGEPRPDGCFVFGHQLFNTGDPIEVERVDVPLRIEKRLAALVHDLANRKRMSIDSFFEETLLHTLDGVGPHTKGDLEYIRRL
jgi:catechol 2,3-dioxygenase-like lactoylglutathione lyase family enzyme